jgi:NAD(P)H-hydrate epimerase
MHLVEDADVGDWLPPRSREAHKWQAAAWVVAGSPGMRGAAALCARAAQRAGAGMVRVGSPGLHASEHPAGEAVARGLPATDWDVDVLADLERFKALVVGPGLGRSPATSEAVRRLVVAAPAPVIVDADGLNALGEAGAIADLLSRRAGSAPSVVLTPHDGEFARLAGHPPGPDRIGAARDLSRRTGAVVLLKGSTTIVADPDGAVLLTMSGDARLATAGTGDVLSGIVGALLSSGLTPLRAAALAAHLHGRAAALGPERGLVAGDLPDRIPSAIAAALRGPTRTGSVGAPRRMNER